MNDTDWKRITPIPPEFNGFGYAYECRRCKRVVTYLGKEDYPPFKCECYKETQK